MEITMKFLENTHNKEGVELYTFVLGEKELEILAKLSGQALKYTPKTFENMQYEARLRNIAKEFAYVYAESKEDKTFRRGKKYKDWCVRFAKLLKI